MLIELQTHLRPNQYNQLKKEIIGRFFYWEILPAIKKKWPREEIGCPIFIQQDNAKTHIDFEDEEFCRVAFQDGFDIRLMHQPTNCPNLNVLDLNFFSAIWSLQHKESPKSIDELVDTI